MKINLFSIAILTLLLSIFVVACKQTPVDPLWPTGPTEQVQSGLYFADIEPLEHQKYAIVYEDKINFIWGNCSVFKFSLKGDSYYGQKANSEIEFKIIGNNMTASYIHKGVVGQWSTITQLKFNPNFYLSDEEPIKAIPPQNVAAEISKPDKKYFIFLWSYPNPDEPNNFFVSGVLEASLESKAIGTDDFILIWQFAERAPPFNGFHLLLSSSYLGQGTHILRLKHLGGPFIQEGKKIRLSLDSDPLYYMITIDSNGSITNFEQISESQ